ncbi:MAG: DUF1553 domain-containing protein [Bryobacterales bacterium]|nr:DUF1553 domain-containing protein [Bryobacterales bacterium]
MRLLRHLALVFAVASVAVAEPPKQENPFSEKDRAYWAFQPVQRAAVPAAGEAHPVDAFIAEKLAKKGLEIGPEADKVTLIRRASFDLIGLPPTPEEVDSFVNDKSPDAFDKVIERLLASPHYGERWARHWLDLARYAESNGFKSDETRPTAWRYRDYVIRSFNEDKPYDLFVKEQIAGDELYPHDPWAHVATGFNRNYPDESNAANLAQRRAELLQDVTDAVGATFLGLTVGCAKCHNHKFDAILQKDYYRLQAFFANAIEDDQVVLMDDASFADYKAKRAVWEEKTKAVRDEMEAMIAVERQAESDRLFLKRDDATKGALAKSLDELSPFERQMFEKHWWQLGYTEENFWKRLKGEKKDRYLELQAELAKYEDLNPGEAPTGMGLKELGTEAPPTHILGLANYAALKEEVEPGFLSVLDPAPAELHKPEGVVSTGRRSALANWLADANNPLTARVMANRIWHYHFGRGIVGTPSDFGRMGERPSHPELLDWLTSEFVSKGWSVKDMHRLIMTSRTYRQASTFNESAQAKDPFDKLLWRFPPQRLEGEVIRDSMLAVAGKLNPAVGGPSVFPPLPDGMPKPRGGWDATDDPAEQTRRSVYIFVRRNNRYPMMQAFDMPDTHESCARRSTTITAPQALSLLNDEQTVGWAQALAERVLERAGADKGRQVDEAFLLAYSRKPDGFEKDSALTFFDAQRKVIEQRMSAGELVAAVSSTVDGLGQAEAAALVDFCHALLNSNEFVFQN